MTDQPKGRANHLVNETSPYLLQHAYNPVDWYPWGEEAIAKAKKEGKPIFLSIGYSACHWCHVMEHESFENEEIAAILNEKFVAIKVDREERPDLDHIYMSCVQLLSGRGGWPMSVFLTPELEPFYGGTYFPPKDRMGMPGFDRVLNAVADAWATRREDIVRQARDLTEQIRASASVSGVQGPVGEDLLDAAFQALDRSFDDRHGGFGGAPKFPHPMDLQLLLRYARRKARGAARAIEMVRVTLDRMATGGIYDHLAGGFHRYSVDERWLVPHFEKMLYDNALLARTYLEAHQATGEPRYGRVAAETLDYVLAQMTSPEGAFYSTEDADSEGEEGKFYVWTKDEIDRILGAELSATFCYCYDVTEFGNWEGRSILNQPKTPAQCAAVLKMEETGLASRLAEARRKLLAARAERVRPGRDEKVLTDWNALMIHALALGGRVLDDPRYLDAAGRAAAFLLDRMRDADGQLLHSYKDERARFPATADDYAFLIQALVTLYETHVGDPTNANDGPLAWLAHARRLADAFLDQYWDAAEAGFFFTAAASENLIARSKIAWDNATPSANGVAASALQRLAKLTGDNRYHEYAEKTLVGFRGLMSRLPNGCSQLLLGADLLLSPPQEIALVSPDASATRKLLHEIYRRFAPATIVAASQRNVPSYAAAVPLLRGKSALQDAPTLYVCENFTCAAPAVGIDAAIETLEKTVSPRR